MCPRLFCLALLFISSAALAQDGGTPERPRPTALRDDAARAPAQWKSKAPVWDSKETSRFGLAVHRALAAASVACSEELVNAQYRQDILLQFTGPPHFDNCAFSEAFQYINDEIAAVDALPRAPPVADEAKVAKEAMAHLGRVLHALQDFYAHSNWVELHHQLGVTRDEKLVAAVWTPEGQARVRSQTGLVTGYVWWDGPQRCATNTPSHGELSKDSPSSPSGKKLLSAWSVSAYTAAFTLATQGSGQFLRWAYDRWPVLTKGCGQSLYLVTTPDVRPE